MMRSRSVPEALGQGAHFGTVQLLHYGRRASGGLTHAGRILRSGSVPTASSGAGDVGLQFSAYSEGGRFADRLDRKDITISCSSPDFSYVDTLRLEIYQSSPVQYNVVGAATL